MKQTGKRLSFLFALLLSGGCFHLAQSLSHPHWWAFWLAPVPVLALSLRIRPIQAFGLAFAARLIGYLSWYPYLSGFLPLAVTIIFITIFPLIFAVLILLSRNIIRRLADRPMVAVLVYPVVYTSFEFLLFLFSRDGTFGSIAYTQFGCTALIQLASFSGMLGITFLISFIAASLSLALYYLQYNKPVRNVLLPAITLLLVVLTYGWVRLQHYSSPTTEVAGMIAYPHNAPINTYLEGITMLAGEGAMTILLPEKVMDADDTSQTTIQKDLRETALRLHVTIIAGVARKYADHAKCEAWVFTPDSRQPLTYQKVNLFEGETIEGFTPGKDPGFFDLSGLHCGVAICKDLDFERYMLRYGGRGTSILWVPAWDFDRDGWLHSRMAMMRGIELGCPIVRNARDGRMTISDSRGRVLFEAISEGNRQASLVAPVAFEASPTFYQKWGDWFGWLNLIAFAGLGITILRRRFDAKKDRPKAV
jgi:apolipoprotein N-acyltransferase